MSSDVIVKYDSGESDHSRGADDGEEGQDVDGRWGGGGLADEVDMDVVPDGTDPGQQQTGESGAVETDVGLSDLAVGGGGKETAKDDGVPQENIGYGYYGEEEEGVEEPAAE